MCGLISLKSDGNPAGISSIYIATIDPSNPTQLTSTCSVITVPEYVWELERYKVNEGPAVLQKDGKYIWHSRLREQAQNIVSDF